PDRATVSRPTASRRHRRGGLQPSPACWGGGGGGGSFFLAWRYNPFCVLFWFSRGTTPPPRADPVSRRSRPARGVPTAVIHVLDVVSGLQADPGAGSRPTNSHRRHGKEEP